MSYIGPHKYSSYINPNNTDEDKHMWLSAENWSEALKNYLAKEDRSNVFVSEIKINNKNSTVHWDRKNWISTRNAE